MNQFRENIQTDGRTARPYFTYPYSHGRGSNKAKYKKRKKNAANGIKRNGKNST